MSPLVELDRLTPQPVAWLWPGWLAVGKLAILDGDPGQGKSLVTLDLAARVSRGGELPDGHGLAEPGGVILMNCEDGLCDTVVPRLLAGGADLGRVASYARTARPADGHPVFPDCVAELEGLVTQRAARLLVVDPLTAFLAADHNSHSDQSVRAALRPVAAMAERTGCAVLFVRHLCKGQRSGQAIYRGTGSVGIIGVTRTALFLARSPRDPDARVLAIAKSNLGPAPPALAFRLDDRPGGPVPAWLGPVEDTADDLTVARPVGPRLTAAGWLRNLLAGGPRPQAEVAELARAAGISERTLDRAKAELPALSRQVRVAGRTAWEWYLPAVPHSNWSESPLPPLEECLPWVSRRG